MFDKLKEMFLEIFLDKKEKAIRKAHDPMRLNQVRRVAISYLIEMAEKGDEDAISTLIKCFHLLITRDQHDQDYDDEKEKLWILDELARVSEINEENNELVLTQIKKELKCTPFMGPKRIDGIVRVLTLLEQIIPPQEVVDVIYEALQNYDPEELTRSPERKVEMIAFLCKKELINEKSAKAIIPFLKDVDESVRYRTVETSLANANEEILKDPLIEVLLIDESERIRSRITEGFENLQWSIKGHPRRKDIENKIAPQYTVDKKGVLIKS